MASRIDATSGLDGVPQAVDPGLAAPQAALVDRAAKLQACRICWTGIDARPALVRIGSTGGAIDGHSDGVFAGRYCSTDRCGSWARGVARSRDAEEFVVGSVAGGGEFCGLGGRVLPTFDHMGVEFSVRNWSSIPATSARGVGGEPSRLCRTDWISNRIDRPEA
jgi:hypothetical protein